ncbi:uncharacterized protein LOC129607284 [Condylostylus longicornis]|uniref:uncharacterized protein LOC129607284 n=1 Tax=Condylostylus longicornis TaxID=2530218 RepID=UPI00244DD86D|nr:uncharacterized protein LOC129607284 [Condylostylus longicornis]
MKKNCNEFIMLILTSLILSCNAFWWRTTTEATPLLRQMPISYFRTYTYHQPVGYPGSLFQSPTFNQYSPANRFAGWSEFPSASNGLPVLANYRQEMTTTTTSPPSTQTTSTTIMPTQPPPQPPSTHLPLLQGTSSQSHINLPLQSIPNHPSQYSLSSSYISSAGHHYIETHPPSAQYLTSGPIRTSYLTPDYPNQYYYTTSTASNPSLNMQTAQHSSNSFTNGQQFQRQQIRFVPCMCPVAVSIPNEFPESRSISNDDSDDMVIPETNEAIKTKENDDVHLSS